MRTTSTREAASVPAPGRPDERRWRLPGFVAPAALLVLAVAVIWASLGLGYWTSLGPGPGFFPLWLAALLGVLSVMWFVEQVRSTRAPSVVAEELAPVGAVPPEEPDTPIAPAELITIVISLVVLAALLEVLGFQLSMLLFLFFHLKVLGRRGWLLTIALSLVGSFGVYTLFAQVLSVNLPVSAIPFLQSLGL